MYNWYNGPYDRICIDHRRSSFCRRCRKQSSLNDPILLVTPIYSHMNYGLTYKEHASCFEPEFCFQNSTTPIIREDGMVWHSLQRIKQRQASIQTLYIKGVRHIIAIGRCYQLHVSKRWKLYSIIFDILDSIILGFENSTLALSAFECARIIEQLENRSYGDILFKKTIKGDGFVMIVE